MRSSEWSLNFSGWQLRKREEKSSNVGIVYVCVFSYVYLIFMTNEIQRSWPSGYALVVRVLFSSLSFASEFVLRMHEQPNAITSPTYLDQAFCLPFILSKTKTCSQTLIHTSGLSYSYLLNKFTHTHAHTPLLLNKRK